VERVTDNLWEYEPGEFVDLSKRIIVKFEELPWLFVVFPEIREMINDHPEWSGRSFIIEPLQYYHDGALHAIAESSPNDYQLPTVIYPTVSINETELVGVAVHQRAYPNCDSIHIYRLDRR
jgi:hypothetical protein